MNAANGLSSGPAVVCGLCCCWGPVVAGAPSVAYIPSNTRQKRSGIQAVVGSSDIMVGSCAAINPALAVALKVPESLLRLETVLLLPGIILLSLLFKLSFVLLSTVLFMMFLLLSASQESLLWITSLLLLVFPTFLAFNVPSDSALVGVPAVLAPFCCWHPCSCLSSCVVSIPAVASNLAVAIVSLLLL